MDPATFADLTDAQIWGIYFRPRDEKGRLVRENDNRRRRRKSVVPGPAELKIPDEVFAMVRPGYTGTPPMQVITTYFYVWSQRGLKTPEIVEKYRNWLMSGHSG